MNGNTIVMITVDKAEAYKFSSVPHTKQMTNRKQKR
jgi:hypothetical protein